MTELQRNREEIRHWAQQADQRLLLLLGHAQHVAVESMIADFYAAAADCVIVGNRLRELEKQFYAEENWPGQQPKC